MSFQSLIEDLKFEGEEYILQKKGFSSGTPEEDALGSLKRSFGDTETLNGIIQKPSHDPQLDIGQEERADHYGFFEVTFEIPDNDLAEYRIKHIFPSLDENTEPYIRYFRIKTIDRNLRWKTKHYHYEMTLELLKQNTEI